MLDKKSYKLLKQLYKVGELNLNTVYGEGFSSETKNKVNELTLLSNLDFIQNNDKVIRITPLGRGFVEQKKNNFRLFIFPYIITTLIAIASILATILSSK